MASSLSVLIKMALKPQKNKFEPQRFWNDGTVLYMVKKNIPLKPGSCLCKIVIY